MPRDQRLYMTFPIDFLDHPKIAILSDNAVRTFIAMNGYSRVHHLDGKIPQAAANTKWKAKSLLELQNNHAERPSVRLVGDDFVIHNYAEHQLTNSDIEDLREKRAAAGAKGGKATASARANAKQTGSKPVAESESRSESGLLTDVTNDFESSQVPSDGAEIDSEWVSLAKESGISDLAALQWKLSSTVGQHVTARGAIDLANAIVSKAKKHVGKVEAYVSVACRDTPLEVQAAFFELDIEVAS